MKSKKWLTLLLSGVMALSVGALAACGKDDDDKQDNQPGDSQDTNNPGGTNKPDDKPNPTPGGNYTLDETEYYLAGDGAGSLSANGWNETDHVLVLKRDVNADHNVFKIQIEMYAGDEFKIVHDDSWTGEMGIWFMDGVDEAGNVQDAEGNVIFAESGQYGGNICLQAGYDGVYTFSLHTFPEGGKSYITYAKDDDLEALPPKIDMYLLSDIYNFGFGEANKTASHMEQIGNNWKYVLTVEEKDLKRDAEGNVVKTGAEYVVVAVRNEVTKMVTCDEGREPTAFIDGDEYNLLSVGVYTLMYNPAEDVLTITDGAFDLFFVVGDTTETSAEYRLTEDNNGNWYGYITLTATSKVKLYNPRTAKSYSEVELGAGEYFFKFTTAEEKAEYEKCGYYIAGTLVEGAEWGVGAASPKLEWDEVNGVYTIDLLDTVDGTFKVLYGTRLGGKKSDDYWYSDTGSASVAKDDFGNIILAAGDYVITFNPVTKLVTISEKVIKVTVSFDLNYPAGVEEPAGQTAPASQTINKGALAKEPTEELTLEGYTFIGWYLDSEHKEEFDFGAPVKGDITLYAYWLSDSEDADAPKIIFNLNYTGATEAVAVETVDGLIPEGSMPADPERDGYYFLGWYKMAGGTAFDFETPVKVDTTVYAKWLEKDTHVWHIVGTNINGIGSWEPSDTKLTLTNDDAYPKQNVFTITLTLTSSASFKILGVTGWNQGYEVGAGSLTGGNGELGGSGDIVVNKTGKYTLILSTSNNGKTVSLTYTFEALVLENDIYFYVNGVEGLQLNSDGHGTWTGSITVKAGDVIKLVDKKDNNKEYPVNITKAGDYFVKLIVSTGEVMFEEYGYYLAGGFAGAEWGIGETSPKMTWDASAGVYTFELTVSAGDKFKVVYGYSGFVKSWISNADSSSLFTWDGEGNLVISAAGTYIITYNAATGKIGVAAK